MQAKSACICGATRQLCAFASNRLWRLYIVGSLRPRNIFASALGRSKTYGTSAGSCDVGIGSLFSISTRLESQDMHQPNAFQQKLRSPQNHAHQCAPIRSRKRTSH